MCKKKNAKSTGANLISSDYIFWSDAQQLHSSCDKVQKIQREQYIKTVLPRVA